MDEDSLGDAVAQVTMIDDQIVADGTEDPFPLLCLSKPMFAAAILHASYEGLFSLNDKANKFLGRAYLDSDPTLRELLAHSGRIERDTQAGDWTDDRVLRWICGGAASSEGRPIYTVTSAWFVLGKVIEKAAGLSRQRAFEELLARPLGLRVGFANHEAPVVIRYVSSNGLLQDLDWPTNQAVRARAWPGSGLVGTAADVASFYSWLLPSNIENLPTSLRSAFLDLGREQVRGLWIGDRYMRSYRVGLGAFVGGEWVGQKRHINAIGGDAATGSFAYADPNRRLVHVHLRSRIEPAESSFLRRKRIINQILSRIDAREE